jgi:hypothetical protein
MEKGLLKHLGAATFWVQAEGFPLWLLALDHSFVKQVHLVGGTDAGSYLGLLREQGCDLALMNLGMGRIGLGKVKFHTHLDSIQAGDVVLLSGSIDYIQRHSQHAVNPTIVVCADHIRGRITKFGSKFRWFHLRHSSFGGSTSFKAFLGTNVENF